MPRLRLLPRIGLLALSLLLPALLVGLMAAWVLALTTLSHHDRTLAWVQGTPAQLASLREAVVGHPVFTNGDFAPGGFADHRPAECGAQDVAIGFSRLREFELAPARATLDELVRASGVYACESHVFIFNDLPSPLDPTAWDDSLVTLLLALVLPTGTLLIAYWGFGTAFALPAPWRVPAPVLRTLGLGLAGALAGLVAVEGLGWLFHLAWPEEMTGGDPVAGLGADPLALPVILLVGVYAPFLEELAFRAWLIPVAERAVGLLPACALSTLAFTAIHLPFAGPELAGTLLLGAIFAAVYAFTRSLPACLVAHGGYNVLALALHVATRG
ncbi:CPBP family intramembrane glutamic endopeptidase [Arenimonas sp.]|uniref:CPBP family intramembrane glutamic endopeptidase n=1 Tax=Arenimonas sp. TaxID=1872635 RepID=UPI0035AF6451